MRRTRVNAEIYNELEQIRAARGGVLRPADVVEFARNPSTALHAHFEWDDAKAAHEHRLERARHIIRCTVTVVSDDRPPERAYVSLAPDRTIGDSYRATADVLGSAALRSQLLEQALAEADAWRRRYERLVELAGVFAELDRVRRRRAARVAQQ